MVDRDTSVSLSLSKSDTLRLLQLYQGEPCLYDINTADYRDRKERAAATRRIAAALSVDGFGPKEVSVKFKNLRNSYSQELKKLKDNELSGAIDIDVSRVYWFDVMDSFLRPYVYTRAQKNLLHNEPETKRNYKAEPNEESPVEDRTPSRTTSSSKWIIQQDDSGYTRNKRLCSASAVCDSSNCGDEFVVFGQSVGIQLAKLPLRKALQMQHEIQTLLTHARLSQLESEHASVSTSK